MDLEPTVRAAAKWSNDNQGVVSIAIWLVTLFLGWVTGIFAALRRRPKFKVELIPGPTCCSTFSLNRQHDGHEVHRTAIALYLHVSNVGTAPSSIHKVHVSYRRARATLFARHRWLTLEHETVALRDFQADIGGDLKVFPFLTQASYLADLKGETFLEIGRSTNGIVYFEQPASWGSFHPAVANGAARIRVRLFDVFNRSHSATFDVPAVTLEEARKYNPSFGTTMSQLDAT